MLRHFASILVVGLFLSSLALAAQDKKESDKKDAKEPKFTTVVGTFESYKEEILTLTVEGNKKEFKVPGDTTVGYMVNKDQKKILKAKDSLKDVKRGAFVAVTLDGKKVLGVGVVVTTLPEDKPKEK